MNWAADGEPGNPRELRPSPYVRIAVIGSFSILMWAAAAAYQASPAAGSAPAMQSPPAAGAPAQANVGQAPMNSAMRQAMGGAQSATQPPPASVQSTPTNAMTLTLGSAGGQQGQQAGNSPSTTTGQQNSPSYDSYGIRNTGNGSSNSSGSSNSPTGTQAQPGNGP